ncbi:MAG: right-handed parallel beta-helix repeat-containing protein [Oceanipulchritudo sp.]
MYANAPSNRYQKRFTLWSCATLLGLAAAAGTLHGQATIDENLATNLRYVDQGSASAVEDGSLANPWKTIGQAISWLDGNRALDAKVHIAAGTYREGGLFLTNRTGITILEGSAPGEVIISGSDVWTSWAADGSGNWYKTWTNNWGLSPEQNPGDSYVEPEKGRRTEMVFIDGILQRQVTDLVDMADGTYFVDEAADRIYIRPMWGINPATATVEVSVRKNLLQIQTMQDIVLRNLVFQHAATGGSTYPNASTIFFNGSPDNGNQENDPAGRAFVENVLLDNVVSRLNNTGGLTLANSKFITIRNSQFLRNGTTGMGANRIQSVEILDSDFSWNNWRAGLLGGVYGWAPSGIKILFADAVSVSGCRFTGNHTVGLWFDTGCTNINVSRSMMTHNWNTGLYHEVNPGLLTADWLLVRDNAHFPDTETKGGGILFAESEAISISNSYLINNAYFGLGFRLRDLTSKAYWDPVDTFDGHSVVGTTFNDNVVAASRSLNKGWSSSAQQNGNAIASVSDTNNNGYYAVDGVPSYTGDHNRFYSPFTTTVFSQAVATGFGWTEGNLAYWQGATGDDANSSWDSNWEDALFWDAFKESNGLLVIEAEDTHANEQRSDTVAWTFGHGFEAGGYPETGGWGYLQTVNGSHPTGLPGTSARMVYRILVSNPGTYSLAIRRLAPTNNDDSVFVVLDGVQVGNDFILAGAATRWEWLQANTSLGFLDAGIHTLELVRREDGMLIDRLMLADDPAKLPLSGSNAIGPEAALLDPPPAAYIAWAKENTIEGPDAALVIDVEKDSLINLVEFALDTDPLDPSSGLDKLPRTVAGGADLFYQFTLGQDSSAVRYTVEFSHDLVDWTHPTPELVEGSAGDPVSLQLSPFAPGQPVFGRLKVESIE